MAVVRQPPSVLPGRPPPTRHGACGGAVYADESGTTSRLTMPSLSALEGARFHVSGTEGAWRTFGKDPQEIALRFGTLPGSPGFEREGEDKRGELSIGGPIERTAVGTGDYGRYYRELADALGTGAPVPVDPQDSVDALRLIEAAHRASHTTLR